ncbi:MAG: PKD domain-containing protein [Cyclobacteriaceae bacterium]|nr:PKD domain-containing protein [Cyclobacteriaceae bacterium]MCH8516055.1 PKD domain-containing protein [Cyclobacteriaceae bacterium]
MKLTFTVKFFLTLSCAYFLLSNVHAQKFSNHNWYFGQDEKALLFRKSNAIPYIKNNMATAPTPFVDLGAAVATNPLNGDLLFYTDGRSLYDATHQIMVGATEGLNSTVSGVQSVVIRPIGNSAAGAEAQGRFAIYTINNGTLYRSEVNMSADGNRNGGPQRGELSEIPLSTDLQNRVNTLKIIKSQFEDNRFWLFTQNSDTRTIEIFDLGLNGVVSDTPDLSINLSEFIAGGNFTVQHVSIFRNHGRHILALSPREANRNVVLLLLDEEDGELRIAEVNNDPEEDEVDEEDFEPVIRLLNTASSTIGAEAAIFATAFSQNGEILYISQSGSTDGNEGRLISYNLNANGDLPRRNLREDLHRSFDLQLGPDGNIYHLYQASENGNILLGQITESFEDTFEEDNLLDFVSWEGSFLTEESWMGRSFPEVAPKRNVDVRIDIQTEPIITCTNIPIKFFGQITPEPDSVLWDFGDGNTSNALKPIYEYAEGGTFTILLTAFLGRESFTDSLVVNVDEFEDEFQWEADNEDIEVNPERTIVCPEEFPFRIQLAEGDADIYVWRIRDVEGSGQQSPPIDSAGVYWVTITKGECTTYEIFNVVEYGSEEQRRNIWYFGDNAGIDFNPLPDDPAIPISNSVMQAPQATAIVGDGNGDVLFFSDGRSLWNRNEALITDQLNGSPDASQSVAIMAFPEDASMYYVFTTEEVFGSNENQVSMTLVDLKANDGLGDVVRLNKRLFAKSTERLAPIGDNWLLAHELGNNTFRAYPLTNQGLGSPVLSSIGSAHNGPANSRGYMKAFGTQKVAVAVGNAVELFDFDQGELTNERRISPPGIGGLQAYGIEFSGDGSKLFFTARQEGGPSKLYEYYIGDPVVGADPDNDDLDNGGSTDPELISEEEYPLDLGAIQTAPDGRTYVAIEGSQFLGEITINPDREEASNFRADGFELLGGTRSRLGLPNYSQIITEQLGEPGMAVEDGCTDELLQFAGQQKSDIDEFSWTFFDEEGRIVFTSEEQAFEYAFEEAGNYTVQLTISNRCEGVVFNDTEEVTIFASPDLPPGVPALGEGAMELFLCTGPVSILDTPQFQDYDDTGIEIELFSLGASGTPQPLDSDEISSPGNYRARLTNDNGCQTAFDILAIDSGPQLNFDDIEACQFDDLARFDAGVSNVTYEWTVTDEAGNVVQTADTRNLNPNTDVAGNFTVNLRVVQAAPFNCESTESFALIINPTPVIVNFETQNETDCGEEDGLIQNIQLELNGQPAVIGQDVLVRIVGQGQSQELTENRLQGLAAGAYRLIVENSLSGCSAEERIIINADNSSFEFELEDIVLDCDEEAFTGNLQSRVTPLITDFQAEVIFLFDDGRELISTWGTLPAFAGTDPIRPGIHQMTINLTDGCTHTANLEVIQADDIQFFLNEGDFNCDDQTRTVTIEPQIPNTLDDFIITWEIVSIGTQGGFNIIGDSSQIEVIGGGTYRATISPSDPDSPFCPTSEEIVIAPFASVPTVSIDLEGDTCEGFQLLTAEVDGDSQYSFRWLRDGNPIAGANGSQLTVARTGVYSVEVRDALSSCVFVSDEDIVIEELQTPIDVSIFTAQQACGNEPLIVEARLSETPDNLRYIWLVNGQQTGPNASSITLNTNLSQATVSLRVGVGQCLYNSSELNVSREPFEVFTISTEAKVCSERMNTHFTLPDSSVELQSGYDYQWFRNGVPFGNGRVQITTDGFYELVVTSPTGRCIDESQAIDVVQLCEPELFVPNAFKPQSAVSQNRTFKVFAEFIDSFEIQIFNRWGEIIFFSDRLDFEWDGTFNGRELPGASYPYVIRYTTEFEEGVQKIKRGGIQIVR